MNVHIVVHKGSERIVLNAEKGVVLSSALREAGLLALPCGVGKCGKCLIYAATEPSSEEIAVLGNEKIAKGLRLACCTKAEEGLAITLSLQNEPEVLTAFNKLDYEYDPLIKRKKIEVSEPSLEDQRTDLQRLLDGSGCENYFLSGNKLAKLPYELRKNGVKYAVIENNDLIGFSDSETSYGLIVDIGTTTVAMLLINTAYQTISALGRQNAQAPFGADVISRIHREIEWRNNGCKGDNPLQHAIISQINDLMKQMLSEHNVEDADFICFTGNTTMMHMLSGLPSEFISKAPFIPVMSCARRLHAEYLGIRSQAVCYLMPCISSYIGADIVASLLAANAHYPQEPFILIDLGTNAEIVLHWENNFLSCSAAAGPCFEGATLSCGMAGSKGAIDKVSANGQNGFIVSTIGNAEAEGICGSGIIDSAALLLDEKIIDETGRLCESNSVLSKYVHGDSFYLTKKVFISQKDIREIQLAKAAVRAGIEVLLSEADLRAEDIHTLYLAGGFGSSIRKESAVRIGLIPESLRDKVYVLGNGAGFGALRYVTEAHVQEKVNKLTRKMRYIELSNHADFSNSYVEHMIFPV